jgi:hypothetical protein
MYAGLHVKYPLFLSDFNETNYLEKSSTIKILWKPLSGGNELFHADGQTDRYDEVDSRLSQFCERAKKNAIMYLL